MADKTRIIGTPSSYARKHYLYVQEVGSLESREPHISMRKNLSSYLFAIVTRGKGEFWANGAKMQVLQGDCIWIDCRNPYSHKSSEEDPWALTWVHFLGEQAESFYETFTGLGSSIVFRPASITPFIDCIQNIYDEMSLQGPLYELNCNYLLTNLIRMSCVATSSEATGSVPIAGKLNEIREYINSHLSEPITLESIADHFYISRFYLSREYKKQFGITIVSDLNNKRITEAKTMLRNTHESVESIAIACGFKEAGYFTKVFKKSEGMTPLAFRKSWQTSKL